MLLNDRAAFDFRINRERTLEDRCLEFYQKGEVIPLTNGGVWQVYRGAVQLYRFSYNEQKEVVLGWVTPNHAFGSFLNDCKSYKAVAITDAYIRNYQSVEIKNNPQLARQLLSELSYRLIRSEQIIGIVSLRKVEDRLKGLLQMLKEEMGHPVDGGMRLTARFTHQNLADAICTTRVTVTRILGDLQTQDLVAFDRDRHLIIKF